MYSDIIDACNESLALCEDFRAIDLVKSTYLGKKSYLQQQFIAMRQLPEDEKKQAAISLNILRDTLDKKIQQAYHDVKKFLLDAEIRNTKIDPTAPLRRRAIGGRHPISLARERLVALLHALQFDVCDGPEIEDDEHNFTLLNVGHFHPARAEQDTFYIKDTPYLLRTHTSPVQIRALKQRDVPLRIMAPGRVYRADMDATHTPMFHQLEGMVIDKNIHMGHLKGMVIYVLKRFFDRDDLRIRFRPGYFPFTEPSAEVDIWWNGRWLEVLGCGMVHPKVMQGLSIDASYSGYAFGLGIDRLAMLRYGVDDLRMMFENDHRMNVCFTRTDL